MRRVHRLGLLAWLLAANFVLAQTPATSASSAPIDLTGEWRQLEAVLDLVQEGVKVTGTFRYVAPNGYAIQAGDRAFHGQLDGRRLTGLITSRGVFHDCPGVILERRLELTLDEEQERLQGFGVVESYLVEDCKLQAATRKVKIDLRRNPCDEQRRAYEEAREEAKEVEQDLDDAIEEEERARAREALKVEATVREGVVGSPGQSEAVKAANRALDEARARRKRARQEWVRCNRENPDAVCNEWREKFEAIREEWGERLSAYAKAASGFDAALLEWVKKNQSIASRMFSAADAYKDTYPQFLKIGKLQNPEWVGKAVQAVATAEEVVGWVLIAKGAVSAAGRGAGKALKEGLERSAVRAATRASARFPRMMRWLEKTMDKNWVARLTGVSEWSGKVFKLRNLEYFRFAQQKWIAKANAMIDTTGKAAAKKWYGKLKKRWMSKLGASKNGDVILHHMDEVRWDSFRGAVTDLEAFLKKSHPGQFDQIDIIFTGSSSGVAKQVMKSGKLPSMAKMKGMPDYAGLGSDIDFQFVMRRPGRQGNLVGNLDEFYEAQAMAERKFNEFFVKRMGFHPDLVEAGCVPRQR